MSTNAINNNSGKQEISNFSSLPFVSETNQLSNNRIKKIINDSIFIPSQETLIKYLDDNKMRYIGKASFRFVLSESTYEESSNSSLMKKTRCNPVNSSHFSNFIPFDMLSYQNTFSIVNNLSPQLKNVELYVKKYFEFDGFIVNENENPISNKFLIYQVSPRTSLSLYGQTDFPLLDNTISARKACLCNHEIKEFIDESSPKYLKTPQSQLSYNLLPSSNANIDEIVKQIKTDPKI